MYCYGLLYSGKRINLLTNDQRLKDSLFVAEMLWLTEGDEEPVSLADIEISETLADETEVEVWSCDALGLADTFWLRLVVTL